MPLVRGQILRVLALKISVLGQKVVIICGTRTGAILGVLAFHDTLGICETSFLIKITINYQQKN